MLGVISVEVDLARLEASWAGTQDAVMVVDGAGQVVLATERRWRGLSEAEALDYSSAPSSILRALRVTQDWARLSPTPIVSGEAVMRRELRVPSRAGASWASPPTRACASG
jgi:two-component system C4-dicarboxylate transport sensor histidine kinase DctB